MAKGDHRDPRAAVLETMIPDRAGRCYPALGVRACTHLLGTRQRNILAIDLRSYWIPGSYAPALSENRHSFLTLLKNKGFKEESMTKVRVYAIDTSTTLESNKSHF